MHEEIKTYKSVDDAVLKPLIRNHLNTDQQIVANSVTAALLKLAPNNHFGAQADEAILNQDWSKCKKELITIGENSPQRKAGIDHILARANEPFNGHDFVTLYLPKEQASVLLGKPVSTLGEDPYVDTQIYVPLWVVLPIVWRALQDDCHFSHHYSGTIQEKLAAAETDRDKRLSTFFNILDELVNKSICHQGVRHELVFSLNQLHDQVDIIEDARAIIVTYVRDTLRGEFLETFNNAQGEKKQSLFKAVLSWMESEVGPLLEILGKKPVYLAALKKTFLAHASNPEVKPLKGMLEQAFEFSSFACSPKENQLLYQVNHILTAPELPDELPRTNALTQVRKWLKQDFNNENHTHNTYVAIFYSNLNLQADLIKQYYLLIVSGTLARDRCIKLLDLFDTYFLSIIDKIDNLYMSPQQLEPLIELSHILKQVRDTDCVHEITSYFSLLYKSEWEERRRVYQLIFNLEFTRKVIWENNAQLEKHIKTTILPNKQEREVIPYEINRTFLHALLVKPENWFSEFAAHLEYILKFVTKCFNEPTNALSKQLLEDSYPNALLEHLSDLFEYYRSLKNPEHPAPQKIRIYFFLPDNINDINNLSYLKYFLSKKQLLDAYRIHHHRYFELCYQSIRLQYNNTKAYAFFCYLLDVPDEFKRRFIDHYPDVQKLLWQAAKHAKHDDLRALLNYFKDKQQLDTLLRMVNDEGESLLHVALYNSNDLIFETIHEFFADQSTLLALYKQVNSKNLSLFHLAIQEHRLEPLKILVASFKTNENKIAAYFEKNKNDDDAFKLIFKLDTQDSINMFSTLLSALSDDTSRFSLLNNSFHEPVQITLFDKLLSLSFNFLLAAIKSMQSDKSKSVLLEKIHKSFSIRELHDFYTLLDLQLSVLSFEHLQVAWDRIIPNINALSQFINVLTPELFKSFSSCCNKILATKINNPSLFRILAKNLNSDKVFPAFLSLEKTLLDATLSERDFYCLTLFMQNESRNDVFSKLKSRDPSWKISAEDNAHDIKLNSIYQVFTEENSKRFFKGDPALFKQLPKVIRNHSDLKFISKNLTDAQYEKFVELFAEELPFVICSVEDYCDAIQDSTPHVASRMLMSYQFLVQPWSANNSSPIKLLNASNKDQRKAVLSGIKPILVQSFENHIELFVKFFTVQLHLEAAREVLTELHDDLPRFIKSVNDFIFVAKLKCEFQPFFIDQFLDLLPKVIKSISEFYSLKYYLSESQILSFYYSNNLLFAQLTKTVDDITKMGSILNKVVVFDQFCLAIRDKVIAHLPALLNTQYFEDHQHKLRLFSLYEIHRDAVIKLISCNENIRELTRNTTEAFFPNFIVQAARDRLLVLIDPVKDFNSFRGLLRDCDHPNPKPNLIIKQISRIQFKNQIKTALSFNQLVSSNKDSALYYLQEFPQDLVSLFVTPQDLNLLLAPLEIDSCVKVLKAIVNSRFPKKEHADDSQRLIYNRGLLAQITRPKRQLIFHSLLSSESPKMTQSNVQTFEMQYNKFRNGSWMSYFQPNILKPNIRISAFEIVVDSLDHPESFTATAFSEMLLWKYN